MHIHFDSDNDDDAPSTSGRLAAPAALINAACLCETRVQYNFNDPAYVFRVAKPHAGQTVAAALSTNIIKLYTLSNGQLVFVGDLNGHTRTVADISFPLPDCDHALYSCSADGTVLAWDTRSGSQAEKYEARHHGALQELFSFAVADNVVAAGGQGSVFFWDRRTQGALACYEDTHMDDVTQVKLHTASGRAISGSQSGLITVHDISSGFDEDEGFLAALNVNTSVEEMGVYGDGEARLWVRTGTETLHLWEWAAATQEDAMGGDGCFLELPEARSDMAAAASTSTAAPKFPQVDYIVTCRYDEASRHLYALAGTSEGALGFFPLNEAATSGGSEPRVGPPALVLSGPHNSVVRSMHIWHGAAAEGPMCITGGEDSIIGVWSLSDRPASKANSSTRSTSSQDSGPSRRAHGAQAGRRRAPY